MSLLLALVLSPPDLPLTLCEKVRIELVAYGRIPQKQVEEIVRRCESLYG